VDWKIDSYKDDETLVTIGGLFGYKYQFKEGFMLEGGLGLFFNSGDDDYGDYKTGTDVGLSLKAGYSW
jgi:hypothetical protein